MASPLLKEGGILICLKSQPEDSELKDGDYAASKVGMKRRRITEVHLNDEDVKRVLVVYEKVDTPEVKLPRRNGMAQKKPYKLKQ